MQHANGLESRATMPAESLDDFRYRPTERRYHVIADANTPSAREACSCNSPFEVEE